MPTAAARRAGWYSSWAIWLPLLMIEAVAMVFLVGHMEWVIFEPRALPQDPSLLQRFQATDVDLLAAAGAKVLAGAAAIGLALYRRSARRALRSGAGTSSSPLMRRARRHAARAARSWAEFAGHACQRSLLVFLALVGSLSVAKIIVRGSVPASQTVSWLWIVPCLQLVVCTAQALILPASLRRPLGLRGRNSSSSRDSQYDCMCCFPWVVRAEKAMLERSHWASSSSDDDDDEEDNHDSDRAAAAAATSSLALSAARSGAPAQLDFDDDHDDDHDNGDDGGGVVGRLARPLKFEPASIIIYPYKGADLGAVNSGSASSSSAAATSSAAYVAASVAAAASAAAAMKTTSTIPPPVAITASSVAARLKLHEVESLPTSTDLRPRGRVRFDRSAPRRLTRPRIETSSSSEVDGDDSDDDNAARNDDSDGESGLRKDRATRPIKGADTVESEPETSERPATSSIMWRLIALTWPDRWFMFVGFASLVIAAVASVAIPHFTGQVVGVVASSSQAAQFTSAVVWLILVAVVSTIFTGMRSMFLGIALTRVKARLRDILFRAIMAQDMAFFDKRAVGEITSRLSADTTQMGDSISLNINMFLRNLIQLVGILAFMFALSWKLTVVCFVTLPPVIIASHAYGLYLRVVARRTQKALACANSAAEEAISGITTVKAFGSEDAEVHRHQMSMLLFFRAQVAYSVGYSLYAAITSLLPNLVTACILWVGGSLVQAGELSAGSLVSFLLYQITLSGVFATLADVFSGLLTVVGAADEVLKIIDRKPDIIDTWKSKSDELAKAGRLGCCTLTCGCNDVDVESLPVFWGAAPGGALPCPLRQDCESLGRQPPLPDRGTDSECGSIEFRGVWMAYPSMPKVPVLRGLDLRVRSGQSLALVGPSGSGKSSCLRLLQRMYEPLKGEILLDGVPLSAYEPAVRKRKISIVQQEPSLFARTIFENIVFGLDDDVGAGRITIDQVEDASRDAGAHDFISRLPRSYDSNVQERGASLSGGQKQRVAIARALVRKPEILLLDEYSSALDAKSERQVQLALARMMERRRCTLIIIAHRLTTVRSVDQIAVIDEGRVVELGNHDELMARPDGLYRRLWMQQVGGVSE